MSWYAYTSSCNPHSTIAKHLSAIKKSSDDVSYEELKLYKIIYDEVPCYVTIQDHDFRIIQANKKTLKDFGNVIGKYCYEIYNNSSKRCYSCEIEKVISNQKPFVNERLIIKNEAKISLDLITLPFFDSQKKLTRIIEIANNITESKQAQRLNIVSKTISGITHNIKNVVSLMNAGSYIVETGLLSGEQEKIRNGWTMIQKNIKRLSDTVVSLINYTKDEPYIFQYINLNNLIEDIVNSVKDKAQEGHIKIRLSLDKEIKNISGDEVSLYHAILNLISNSIEACLMDKGKKTHYFILVKSKDYKGTGCFITVKDNGCGIPQKNKTKIFKGFFTTKPGKGTGLGLLITEKTITGHGGMISFDSSKKSTTFSIYLPYRRY